MTQKILAPIDIDNPEKIIKDFLYPKPTENGFELTGIKTDKKSDFGIVILTSEINENDIFKRIIDSGIRIESVEILINTLKNYVEKIPKYKIGNILKIDNSNGQLEFELKYQRLTRKK